MDGACCGLFCPICFGNYLLPYQRWIFPNRISVAINYVRKMGASDAGAVDGNLWCTSMFYDGYSILGWLPVVTVKLWSYQVVGLRFVAADSCFLGVFQVVGIGFHGAGVSSVVVCVKFM